MFIVVVVAFATSTAGVDEDVTFVLVVSSPRGRKPMRGAWTPLIP